MLASRRNDISLRTEGFDILKNHGGDYKEVREVENL